MKSPHYRVAALPLTLIALTLGLTGCGRDATPNAPASSSAVTRQAADDLARHFAGTLSQGGVPLDRVGATSLGAIARGGAFALSPAKGLRLTDEIGFSWSLSVTFMDATGAEQTTYDPETTARMSVVARARGHLSSAEHNASLGIYRALQVDGLLPTETTLELDGSAADTADCSFEARDGSASREYHLLASGALADVRQYKDESVNPYPLSGTASWQVQVDARAEDAQGVHTAHYDATVRVTFNGTRYPTIEVDEHHTYTFDLVTGEVRRLAS
jgi:hypothetical protein